MGTMSDVLLINPKVGFYQKFRENEKMPMAMLCLGTYLEARGYRVKILDQRIIEDALWESTLLSELKTKPICAGITSMTGNQIA